jgi:TATA-box binding protein (TBP) (component of TFIID and TFIIIB)
MARTPQYRIELFLASGRLTFVVDLYKLSEIEAAFDDKNYKDNVVRINEDRVVYTIPIRHVLYMKHYEI